MAEEKEKKILEPFHMRISFTPRYDYQAYDVSVFLYGKKQYHFGIRIPYDKIEVVEELNEIAFAGIPDAEMCFIKVGNMQCCRNKDHKGAHILYPPEVENVDNGS